MRVRCLHGFYLFEEQKVGDISRFVSKTGISLVPKDEYFTFADLEAAPTHSISGDDLLGFVATETFEGKPWEVFEANSVVYDFTTGLVLPISTITQRVKIELSGFRYLSNGLLLAGSLNGSGSRIKSYSGFYYDDKDRWMYSEIQYV